MSVFKAKCINFNFGWGSDLDPTGGAYSATPGPLAALNALASKGREGMGEECEGGRGEKKRERNGRGGELRGRSKKEGPPRVGSHLHVRNPEKIPWLR